MAGRATRRATGRGFWWTLAVLMLVLAMAAAFLAWYLSRGPREKAMMIPLVPDLGARELAGTRGVVLFFADGNGEAAVSRELQMPSRATREDEVREVLEALCDEDPGRLAVSALPVGARPRDVFVDRGAGQVVVDWTRELVSAHPGGSTSEQATLAVILRTLAWNFPELESCVLLVDGAQVETLAGHLDTSRPFDLGRWR
ncbi:GerMN domain-containing protein [bacterium]|nr:GerMN domain-containing protein [bacterium]